MSQGNSIFSSPNGSNGEAPANPFASLAAGTQKAAAASPFAAVTPAEPESPFGFAAEEAAPERPQAKLPEKRTQTPMPPAEDNPFLSAASAPQAEAAPSAPAPAASPFTSESSFEAPAKPAPAPQQESQGFGAAENPLSAPAPTPARAPEPELAPVRLEQPVAAPAPAPQPAQAAPQSSPEFASQAAQAAPVQAAPAQAAPVQQVAALSQAPSGGQSTRQLELRAIFGSEGEMSRDEILTRAKGLPGIREVTVVGPGETSAVQTIGDVMARFGFGGTGSWQMTCSGGVVDFVSSENTTLAVLREGRYSAGVWETLMIVARELGKLS
ncbi:MAG: hypothetical protein ACSHYB_08260 [Roseibacillus sp.]